MNWMMLAQMEERSVESSAGGAVCFMIVAWLIGLGATIFCLVMLWRFVRAHENLAGSHRELSRHVAKISETLSKQNQRNG